MAIKKVAFEFNPFEKTGVKVPRNKMAEARQAVADYILETVLSEIGDARSPVEGGNWKKRLTSDYASEKGSNIANLELTGELLDALDVVIKKGNTMALQVEGDQAPKADGNNRGTYGRSRTHLSDAREFIPRGKKTLRKDIWAEVKAILEEFTDGD